MERTAAAAVREATYERELERAGMDDVEVRHRGKASANRLLRRAVISSVERRGDNIGSSDGGAAKGAVQTLDGMLQDLVRDAVRAGSKDAKGTRFRHVTEFAHEVAMPPAGAATTRASDEAAAGLGEGSSSPADAIRLKTEAEQRTREVEIGALEASVAEMECAAGSERGALESARLDAVAVHAGLLASETSMAVLEEDATTKSKTLAMLPKAAENIGKLEVICEGSALKLTDLVQQWKAYRLPLAETLLQKRNFASARKTKCKSMLGEMKRARREMQAMAHEVRDKEQQAKLLKDELLKMPKMLNRALYTYRIMDIIASIAKQKGEIDKIILEVQQVQKEINAIGERLVRAEELADVKIFATANRDSKKDPAMVRSYRHLQDLRARFDELVTTISRIGKTETDARDTEGKSEQLAERVSKNGTERIFSDIEQVRQENTDIVAKIKMLRSVVN